MPTTKTPAPSAKPPKPERHPVTLSRDSVHDTAKRLHDLAERLDTAAQTDPEEEFLFGVFEASTRAIEGLTEVGSDLADFRQHAGNGLFATYGWTDRRIGEAAGLARPRVTQIRSRVNGNLKRKNRAAATQREAVQSVED